MSDEKRWHKKTPEGVFIEDDGGFVNFFPNAPMMDPGMILGFGIDDEFFDDGAETPKEQPEEKVADVIDMFEWKKQRGR